jgi:hypothetical protein
MKLENGKVTRCYTGTFHLTASHSQWYQIEAFKYPGQNSTQQEQGRRRAVQMMLMKKGKLLSLLQYCYIPFNRKQVQWSEKLIIRFLTWLFPPLRLVLFQFLVYKCSGHLLFPVGYLLVK